MTKFFQTNKCDQSLGPKILDCKLVQDTVDLKICVKLKSVDKYRR